MNLRWLSFRWFSTIAACSLLVIGIAAFTPKRSTVAQGSNLKKFHELLRRGVGAEVTFAGKGSAENARRSVDSVTNFIRRRSGLEFKEEAIRRLIALEAGVRQGTGRRIGVGTLRKALADALRERLDSLTETEIGTVADALGGATIRFRSNQLGNLPRETFIRQLRDYRNGDTLVRLAANRALDALGEELAVRVDHLSAAIPEQWGEAPQRGLTPLQAWLVAYSIVSDDYLWYSEGDLKKIRRSMERSPGKSGVHKTSDRIFPYGVEGYIFSTPLDLVFSDAAVNELIDMFEESRVQ
jgi:hypothetical protein